MPSPVQHPGARIAPRALFQQAKRTGQRPDPTCWACNAQALQEVVACYSIAGDADFLLQVVALDLDAYSDFAMNVVRRLPRIKEVQTTFVLKEVKPFNGFPLISG